MMTVPFFTLADNHGKKPSEGTNSYGQHPKFQHYRPYRPRKVDARRPADPVYRRRGGPQFPGPDPRQHGYRAGARDHDQEPGRLASLLRKGRPELYPEPDRHAGPRRFHLRGVAVARLLRRGVAFDRR